MIEEHPPNEELIARNQDLKDKLAAHEQELRDLLSQQQELRNGTQDLSLKYQQTYQAKNELEGEAAKRRAANE